MFVLQNVYRQEGKKEVGHSLYAQMPQTIETVFAQEVTKAQSDVSFRTGACIMSLFVDLDQSSLSRPSYVLLV